MSENFLFYCLSTSPHISPLLMFCIMFLVLTLFCIFSQFVFGTKILSYIYKTFFPRNLQIYLIFLFYNHLPSTITGVTLHNIYNSTNPRRTRQQPISWTTIKVIITKEHSMSFFSLTPPPSQYPRMFSLAPSDSLSAHQPMDKRLLRKLSRAWHRPELIVLFKRFSCSF